MLALGCVLCHTDRHGAVTQGHGPCCPFYGAASGWSNAGHAYNVSCTCEGEAAATQKAELLHQLRRLSAHPSIAVCECPVFFCFARAFGIFRASTRLSPGPGLLCAFSFGISLTWKCQGTRATSAAGSGCTRTSS